MLFTMNYFMCHECCIGRSILRLCNRHFEKIWLHEQENVQKECMEDLLLVSSNHVIGSLRIKNVKVLDSS